MKIISLSRNELHRQGLPLPLFHPTILLQQMKMSLSAPVVGKRSAIRSSVTAWQGTNDLSAWSAKRSMESWHHDINLMIQPS